MVQAVYNLAFTQFLGLPYIVYGGIFAFILLIATAVAGALVMKGKLKIKNHKILAIITIIFATLHGLLGFLSFL